jgi:hypothetical protein
MNINMTIGGLGLGVGLGVMTRMVDVVVNASWTAALHRMFIGIGAIARVAKSVSNSL